MNNPMDALLAERSTHKLAGIYAGRDEANRARSDLIVEGRLNDTQVRVLGPRDYADDSDALFRQIEPEGKRIPWTLARTHLLFGGIGAVVGVVVFAIAWASGSAMLHSSPIAGLVSFAFFPAVAGLVIAGTVSLRPDERMLATRVQNRLRHGQWAVVAHPVDHRQIEAAGRVFDRSAKRVMRTL